MQRINLTLNNEASLMLDKLAKELKMSKTQILTDALKQMHESKRIEQRKALWIKSFEAFKNDEEYQKEQLELAEAGVGDGII
ncbi:hypothetical protein M8032_001805 [Campylobacter jejuni]|uniref:CopG family transcriptional regulator n=3 Tax=Campylobacter TaxID=194 RepID=A0A381CHY5_CAMCO|nr:MULTISPECIES: hypothetical protein [Campylobacter]AHK73608.1 hypothetical protein YSQ_06530 [Campylobacter coli RM1875]EAH4609628.1 hypothetical protein [Campylobacter jejuni]EAH4635663.1 hypothetical protein [Campylobacter jejuni]EAH4699499.1 hypothetical protein [Campylobacter jejuni]EAH4798262.1 hypothetical protein [Campylobacter coli]